MYADRTRLSVVSPRDRFTSSFTLDQKNRLYYVCFTSKVGAVPWVAQVGLGQIQTFGTSIMVNQARFHDVRT